MSALSPVSGVRGKASGESVLILLLLAFLPVAARAGPWVVLGVRVQFPCGELFILFRSGGCCVCVHSGSVGDTRV